MLRLLLAFSALVVITVASLYAIFTDVSERSIIDQAQKNFSTILTMAEDQLRLSIDTLTEQTLNMMVNPNLYGQMAALENEDYSFYNLIRSDVNKLLSACFYRFPDVISAQILYKDYSFAYRVKGSTNYQSIQKSDAWQKIQNANGSIVWFPPDKGQYFGDSSDEQGNIWLGRALNMTDITHS